MTKEELDQLRSLHEEVRELEKKIEILRLREGVEVTDKVEGSTSDYPYTQTSFKIRGLDLSADTRIALQISAKTKLLEERKSQANELELKILEYINNVPNSKLRRVMEYRFVEGKTWEQIGIILDCDRTTVEKMVTKYLTENE